MTDQCFIVHTPKKQKYAGSPDIGSVAQPIAGYSVVVFYEATVDGHVAELIDQRRGEGVLAA